MLACASICVRPFDLIELFLNLRLVKKSTLGRVWFSSAQLGQSLVWPGFTLGWPGSARLSSDSQLTLTQPGLVWLDLVESQTVWQLPEICHFPEILY